MHTREPLQGHDDPVKLCDVDLALDDRREVAKRRVEMEREGEALRASADARVELVVR
jgi:hypothetical protein